MFHCIVIIKSPLLLSQPMPTDIISILFQITHQWPYSITTHHQSLYGHLFLEWPLLHESNLESLCQHRQMFLCPIYQHRQMVTITAHVTTTICNINNIVTKSVIPLNPTCCIFYCNTFNLLYHKYKRKYWTNDQINSTSTSIYSLLFQSIIKHNIMNFIE